MRCRLGIPLLAALVFVPGLVQPVEGQSPGDLGRADALERYHPDLHDLVLRLERVHGMILGELAREGEAVRARSDTIPTPGFEADVVGRLIEVVEGEGADDEISEADAGYEALGSRGAEVVRWAQAFQREVLTILSDPGVPDRRAALADAVARYRSRTDIALPDVPKNMDVLYGHPHALAFRTRYPELDGLAWAGHWLTLAATEPMTDLPEGPERAAGIDTVTTRYHAKLSYGEPPQAFPTEIPLAPAIAPGLIWLSPESAMIIDNSSMLLEVLGDVLASPSTADVPTSVDAALDYFLDPEQAVTDRDQWEIMALRHGIFFQGGFPLAVMTENERNAGHGAHAAGGMMLMTIPGMPRR